MREESYSVPMTTSATENTTWVPELTFAARLALIRHRMGWNIKEAALACDLPPQSWRGWEIQKRLPHDIVTVAQQIAERTGVDRDWLLFGGQLAEPASRSVRGSSSTGRGNILCYPAVAERMSERARRPVDNRPSDKSGPGGPPRVRQTAYLTRPGGRKAA